LTVTVHADPFPYPYEGGLRPERSALLIVDMQRDFCEAGGYYDAIGGDVARLRAAVPQAHKALLAARRTGFHVLHTRVGRRPDLSDMTAVKRRAVTRAGAKVASEGPMGRFLIRGEPGWQIVPELEPAPGETVIDKPATGAFYATELDHVLRARDVTCLVICGVTTAICVGTTVREAADRGYEVLVLGDACAEGDAEVHRAALEMVKLEGGILGAVAQTDDFLAALAALP